MLRFDPYAVLIRIVGVNDGTRVVSHASGHDVYSAVTTEEEISERTG
jgi:hypothetical protein